MRRKHPSYNIILVNHEEPDFILPMPGGFVVVDNEFGWTINHQKDSDITITVQTLYDTKHIALNSIWVPITDFPVIEHIVKGCSVNGNKLIRCCVCGRIHIQGDVSYIPNPLLRKTYAVCSGVSSSATDLDTGKEVEFALGDCEFQAMTARRSI